MSPKALRVVDALHIHGAPMEPLELLRTLVGPQTRYLVLDLDRTVHLGRNLGELLGWELCGWITYGAERHRQAAERRGSGRMHWELGRPHQTAAYLARGALRWAVPGLTYLMAVKLGSRARWSRRLAHRLLGADPVGRAQRMTREALMHQLSEVPLEVLRELARSLWRRHADDQVFHRADFDALRAEFPRLEIVLSSASPQPVLEVAQAELGVDQVIFTEVECHRGYLSAPHRLDHRFGLWPAPRRVSPPAALRHNAGAAKIDRLRERLADFGQVEAVGVTDTGYGEDHSWTEHFTRLADLNSAHPFSPLVGQGSPLEVIHSAAVLTAGERRTGAPDPRRAQRAGVSRHLTGELLSRSVARDLEAALAVSPPPRTGGGPEEEISALVEAYNEAEAEARRPILRALRRAARVQAADERRRDRVGWAAAWWLREIKAAARGRLQPKAGAQREAELAQVAWEP